MRKYSDLLAEWLVELGYTHCFFVAGGHIMHLLESCSHRLVCIPVIHEAAAGMAAEYFNEAHLGGKAMALVTSGPGLTNLVTALAGAFLESRELLVIGGQVKIADLSRGNVRQRGIQEIDGVALASTLTVCSARIEQPIDRRAFADFVRQGCKGRPGPVFLEIPLDTQGAEVDEALFTTALPVRRATLPTPSPEVFDAIVGRLSRARRPVLLLGGGVSRETTEALLPQLSKLGIPLMLTWNAMDRLPSDHPLNFGRPNTWGQRYANILLQQADLLIALGARLSLQQTGFNWQPFLSAGDVIQVDCDANELSKGHPAVALKVCANAVDVLQRLCNCRLPVYADWVAFCHEVKQCLPVIEAGNHTGNGYLSPYCFVDHLSRLATSEDIIIPCSSGSAFTVMMQSFAPKAGQRIITNKGLASMGYGLGGAIGAAFAGNGRRTILVEGDGGFLQNVQELGTVAANRLPLKIFIFDNNGYASIRTTQRNYFAGHYVGCDSMSGLGMPCWSTLFAAYGIPLTDCQPGFHQDAQFLDSFAVPGPAGFLVHVDPEQTYFPKIDSRVTASGHMESSPLHLMTPALDPATAARVFRSIDQAIPHAANKDREVRRIDPCEVGS